MEKGTLLYYANNRIYFNIGDLVYRSIYEYELQPTHQTCFEWKIFGLKPELQPRTALMTMVERMNHPENCVLDIDATFNFLKFRVIHKSKISNIK